MTWCLMLEMLIRAVRVKWDTLYGTPPPVWDTYSDYSLGRQVIEEPSTERGGGSFARV